jgi:hypothetical protein
MFGNKSLFGSVQVLPYRLAYPEDTGYNAPSAQATTKTMNSPSPKSPGGKAPQAPSSFYDEFFPAPTMTAQRTGAPQAPGSFYDEFFPAPTMTAQRTGALQGPNPMYNPRILGGRSNESGSGFDWQSGGRRKRSRKTIKSRSRKRSKKTQKRV